MERAEHSPENAKLAAIRSHLNLRNSRASSVIIHRVPHESLKSFLDWEHGIINAAADFPGFTGAEAYPPDDVAGDEWVIILHFDQRASLQQWMDSEVRAEWLKVFPLASKDFHLEVLPTGFGPWFATQVRAAKANVPKPWMMALTVLLSLYPTVMILQLTIAPLLAPIGRSASVLLLNAVTVSLLQWGVMPIVTRCLGPWYRGTPRQKIVGSFVIFVILFGFLLVFRQFTE